MMTRTEALLRCQLQDYKTRVERARDFVSRALTQCKKPYVAFSTGKDSTALLNLVREQCPNVAVVYLDSPGCALPESLKLLDTYERQGMNLIRWQVKSFLEIYREVDLEDPRWDAITMKELVYKPVKQLITEHGFDGIFLGLRADESHARRVSAHMRGELFFRKSNQVIECLPLLWWSADDVWTHILSEDLLYNAAYDHGFERVCFWCGQSGRTRGRWVTLKRHWPQLFNQLAAEFPEVTLYV
jgi:3'-phosphoadenosine 5'-phosphosulfate sulfotransferase (PAPS reductase)/FAD synthetase